MCHMSMDFFAKGEYGIQSHFEVLQAPGNAHDGDAEEESENKVEDGDLPPSQENPDQVHHNRDAARLVGSIHQFMTEGPKGIGPQFKKLHAKGDADDGDAHQKADDIIDQGDDKAAQNKPEYVAKEFHGQSFMGSSQSASLPVHSPS